MMIFITPEDTDNRFVVYLHTTVCKLFYTNEGLSFETSTSKIDIIKDFFINYGVKDIEVREKSEVCQLIVHDKDILMQIDDSNNICGLKVPILTII